VFAIGVPEELANAVPVIVIALPPRRRLAPLTNLSTMVRRYLFRS
jgi:hypothetical protein